MNKQSRRAFMGKAGKVAAAAGLLSFTNAKDTNGPLKNIFIHHVYFWLNRPESQEDKTKLLEGLHKLSKVKTIKKFHIGQPAGTTRDVVDQSYAISWMLIFDSKKDQDSYQVDPVHLDFVKNYSHLWSKVIVYDTVDA